MIKHKRMELAEEYEKLHRENAELKLLVQQLYESLEGVLRYSANTSNYGIAISVMEKTRQFMNSVDRGDFSKLELWRE